jgi:rhodanese-related sulfurtransferase
MDGQTRSIPAQELHRLIGSASAPIVADVRSSGVDRVIVSAVQVPDGQLTSWAAKLPPAAPVIVCGEDDDAGRRAAEALRASHRAAAYLEGGMAAWRKAGFPTRRLLGPTGKWVTRERPKIDRIACPWLIRRFIDADAEFIYVPPANVIAAAKETGATPYDIDGVEFSHEGERCSFDTILRIFDIHDPSLDHLAEIVRGADTSRHDLTTQCGGLFAISLGLSANFPDVHEMLKHGMVMYDALYTWCRSLQQETHNWPVKAKVS